MARKKMLGNKMANIGQNWLKVSVPFSFNYNIGLIHSEFIESFEKPQIQNSLRRTLKEIFFENRGYSKSSIECKIFRLFKLKILKNGVRII